MTNKPSQKFCPQCGSPNNHTAKVCVQCGHHFKAAAPDPAQSAEPTSINQLREKEKACPQCGTINKLAAKVCIQCGHHFHTQFEADTQPDPAGSVPTLNESQVTQNPEEPLSLPKEFEAPSVLPPVSDNTATTGDTLEGEFAPDLSNDALDTLREQSSENIAPYERLQRSLQRKQRKP